MYKQNGGFYMDINALITMIITLVLVWGGLLVSVVKLYKEETPK